MAWSNKYIGIPYTLHGRTSEEGLDCWGLVREVYQSELNIGLPSYAEKYVTSIDGDGFSDAKGIEESDWSEVDTPKEYDAIWCRIAGVECHVGVMLDSGRMLHAMQGNDSHIVDINTAAWQRRVVRCYRHRLSQ